MESVANLLEKVKTVIHKIRKSSLETSASKSMQDIVELPHNVHLRCIDVRWSSMYIMLSQFVENKTATNLFLFNDSPKKSPQPLGFQTT